VSTSVPSILISDDDRWFRQTLEEVFEPRGFRTLFAENGAEAVEIVRNEEVHLAVVDMHMPRLTGVEVIREVRRFRVMLPCILVSGALDEDVRREAFAADAFEVLAKPVSLADIVATVASALETTYNWRSTNAGDLSAEE
jgi:CheY-like chemotaxis protein